MYITTIAFATPEYDEAVHLRTTVLREPLGLEFSIDFLSGEFADTHLAAYSDSGVLLGVLMLTHKDENTVKMRQVAVLPEAQNKGIGTALVAHSERLARTQNYQTMLLHARDTAIPFYQKQNYMVVGDSFLEVGILHFAMEKGL